MLTANENRIQAAKARSLSNGLSDTDVIDNLQAYATECDAAAAEADLIEADAAPDA